VCSSDLDQESRQARFWQANAVLPEPFPKSPRLGMVETGDFRVKRAAFSMIDLCHERANLHRH
jgi:hypothetical protein